MTWDELATALPAVAEAVLADQDPDWPGGETAAAVAARARSMAERILDVASSSAVVVVTHGGLLRAIGPHLGLDPSSEQLEPATACRVDPVPIPGLTP